MKDKTKFRLGEALYLLHNTFNKEVSAKIVLFLVDDIFYSIPPDVLEKIVRQAIKEESFMPSMSAVYQACRQYIRENPTVDTPINVSQTMHDVIKQDMNDAGFTNLKSYSVFLLDCEEADKLPYTLQDPETKKDVRVLDYLKR